jgi:D-lactate dehydrogenase
MIITFFECEQWEQDFFTQRLPNHQLQFIDEPIANGVPENTEVLCVFIYSQVSKETIDSLPNLKQICTRSTGFDHVDIDHAKSKGISIYNVPFYGENTVAEHTFALLLAISRQIIDGAARVRAGSFDPHGLRGFDLKDKTFGVIGTGHIGQHVIRMANGFEMNVIAYDPFPKDGLAKKMNFTYVGLDELLSQSNVISLHCPYNDHTHHLLNQDNMQQIQQGTVLLNTARGGLVHNQALLDALQDGRISAAGLDVLEEECHIREEAQILSSEYRKSCDLHAMLVDHALITHPKVLVTPHNAFNSQEALERILDTTVHNIADSDKANKV